MFDNGFPSPTAQRGGLPILSTERLSAAEDALLGELARTFRLAAARLEEARQAGTVARGLEAANLGDRLGQVAGQCAATLGSNR